MVLDDQGVQDGQPVAAPDRGRVEELGDIRIAMVVMVLVGVVDRAEVVLHAGRDPGHPVVLEHGQADRGGQPIGQDGGKEAGDAAVLRSARRPYPAPAVSVP